MENRPERRIVLGEGMIGQITIPLPPNPQTWWKNAKRRVSPEGLLVSGVVSNVAWVTMWPAQTALSPVIHEVPWDRPDLIPLRFAAIALLGIAGAKSVALETRSFKEKKFSISPPGTIAYAGTGRAHLSSIGEHVFDLVLLSSANPFFVAGIVHHDPRLMADSATATLASLFSWNLFWNRLIVNGNVDPAVKKISQIKNSTWSRIKRRENPKIEEAVSVEPAFSIAPTEDLAPGVWVELSGKNDNE